MQFLKKNQKSSYANPKSKEYVIQDVPLGMGSFGTVHRAHLVSNPNSFVVVKKIHKAKFKPLTLDKIGKSFSNFMQIHHRNICQIYFLDEDEKFLYIYMENCPNGDLSSLIATLHSKKALTERKGLEYVRGVLDGYHFMRQAGYVHRDLKLENVLIGADNNPKIADFDTVRKSQGGNTVKTEGVGTILYQAPEILLGNTDYKAEKTDIWSLGVMIYEMFYRNSPFEFASNESESNALIKVKAATLGKKFNNFKDERFVLSSTTKDLIASILTYDPEARLNLEGVLAHPALSTFITRDNLKEFEKYEIDRGQILGQGGFGIVYAATNKATKEKVAAKLMLKNQLGKEIVAIAPKLQLIQSVKHPNVLKIYFTHETENEFWVFMEFCEGKSLGDKIKTIRDENEQIMNQFKDNQEQLQKSKSLKIDDKLPVLGRLEDNNEMKNLISQIFSGYGALRDAGLTHGDLKPDNVLLKNGVPKISDFDTIDASGTVRKTSISEIHTLLYLAPECLKKGKDIDVNYEYVDMWAIGVMLYELFFIELPFSGQTSDEIFQDIKKNCCSGFNSFKDNFNKLNTNLKNLLKKLLVLDPEKRLKISDYETHPYFTGEPLIDLNVGILLADYVLEKYFKDLANNVAFLNITYRDGKEGPDIWVKEWQSPLLNETELMRILRYRFKSK